MSGRTKKKQIHKNAGPSEIRGKDNRRKAFAENKGLFLLGLVICLLLLLLHAYAAGHYANFSPINGTFQNYNPIRRLLDGQVPYRDFQVYLGMGHLYLGAITTVIFGGTYRASLSAFSFLTLLGFACISYIAGKVVFKKKETAILITDIVITILLVQPLFYKNLLAGTDEIKAALDYALRVGNSARYVRGLILPISCGALYLGNRLIKDRFPLSPELKRSILIGIVAGFSFIWSNDFGISSWLCLTIMTFWILLCERRGLKNTLLYTLVEVVCSAVAVFVAAEIFTFGNFGSWITATFGAGGYQSWYYNSGKSYFIWDLDVSFLIMLQAGICIGYLLKMMTGKEEEINQKYVVLAYMNMTSLCAVEEYHLLSGGNSREVAFAVLFVTIFYELLSALFKRADNFKISMVYVIGFVLGVSWIISAVKEEFVFRFVTEKDGIFIEQMGGYVSSLGEDMIRADEFLDGEKFFSTYASGQEVVSNVYQPSGTDYIIHTLGDKQREKYLDVFQTGDFKYAATIKETYSDWEYWAQRANWFFYRELYSKWHPVFTNKYETYWERNTDEKNHIDKGISVEREDINNSTVVISVQCDEQVNGVADVYIDYEVKKKDRKLSLFTILQTLHIENTGTVYAKEGAYYESNYLRDKSSEYIPIPVINGYGEVTLTSNPEISTDLQLNDVTCEKVFTVTSDYVEVSDVTDGETGSVIRVPATDKNSNALTGAVEILYGGNRFTINQIDQKDDGIYIAISGQTEASEQIEASEENFLRVLRETD